jgi:hypothetical protein
MLAVGCLPLSSQGHLAYRINESAHSKAGYVLAAGPLAFAFQAAPTPAYPHSRCIAHAHKEAIGGAPYADTCQPTRLSISGSLIRHNARLHSEHSF